MNAPNTNSPNELMPRPWLWVISLGSLIPLIILTLLDLTLPGWHGSVASMTAVVILQVLAFAVALFAATLSLAQFSRTGDIAVATLGTVLACMGTTDLVQLVFTTSQVGQPLLHAWSWTAASGLAAVILIGAAMGFILSDEVKSSERRRRDTIIRTLAIPVFALLIAGGLALSRSAIAEWYGTPLTQALWDGMPLLLWIIAGVYVLPAFREWHRSIFAQTLTWSCLPMAVAQIHFIMTPTDPFLHLPHLIAASALKGMAAAIPLAGLILAYERTYESERKNLRKLQNQLLMFEQSQASGVHSTHYLKTLMAAIPEPACILDASLGVIAMNEACVELAGLTSKNTLVGKPLASIMGSEFENHHRSRWCAALREGHILEEPPSETHFPGGTRRIGWICHPVKNGSASAEAIVCIGIRAA